MERILFITSSSINGGAQKHIRDMFIALTNKGLQVYLVAPSGWLTDELNRYKGRIFILDASLKNVKKLRSIMDEIKPDIVNTFILSGGCFGYLAWLKKKYGKIFVTVNNPVLYDGVNQLNSILYPQLYKWMAKGCSAFLVKSKTVKDEVAEIIKDRHKAISIKNGIDFFVFNKDGEYKDIKEELGLPCDAFIITNVGMLDKRKGQYYLIGAAKQLVEKYDKMYFLLVGDGDDRLSLVAQIAELGLEERVLLLGKRKDINRVLYYTDIFVLPSLHEGLPNALMEAMSMGLQCVATDVGGVRELISDESLGIVIQPKSESEIKKAIETLLSDGSHRAKMGIASYEKMKNQYELGVVVNELRDIYETC